MHSSAIYWSSVQREQAKMSISQFLPGRNLVAYITSCHQRIQLLISWLKQNLRSVCGKVPTIKFITFIFLLIKKLLCLAITSPFGACYCYLLGNLFSGFIILVIPISSPQCEASDVAPHAWGMPQVHDSSFCRVVFGWLLLSLTTPTVKFL